MYQRLKASKLEVDDSIFICSTIRSSWFTLLQMMTVSLYFNPSIKINQCPVSKAWLYKLFLLCHYFRLERHWSLLFILIYASIVLLFKETLIINNLSILVIVSTENAILNWFVWSGFRAYIYCFIYRKNVTNAVHIKSSIRHSSGISKAGGIQSEPLVIVRLS